MLFKITKKHRLTTTAWSGGTTTQLFIFPEGARYDQRDFLFRVSTAEVKIAETVFTSLPGFRRKLMILEGELLIKHKGHYEKQLKKFEQDEFDGGWETSAIGRVIDFNLMLAPGKEGEVEALQLKEGRTHEVNLKGAQYAGYYFYKGAAEVYGASERTEAEQGDYLSVEDLSLQDKLTFKMKEDCQVIKVYIY